MNFKQVEAFRAVMLSGSMTAAAASLHTSQPNISRLIAQLERQSGFKLFERVGGRLQPTDEGAALFADVERAFIGLHSIEQAAQNIRQGGTGRLRIAVVPSLSLTVAVGATLSPRQPRCGGIDSYRRLADGGALGRLAVLRHRPGVVCGR